MPVVELLLRAGPDPNVRDLFGWSAKDPCCLQRLLAYRTGADGVGCGKLQGELNVQQPPRKGAAHRESDSVI